MRKGRAGGKFLQAVEQTLLLLQQKRQEPLRLGRLSGNVVLLIGLGVRMMARSSLGSAWKCASARPGRDKQGCPACLPALQEKTMKKTLQKTIFDHGQRTEHGDCVEKMQYIAVRVRSGRLRG